MLLLLFPVHSPAQFPSFSIRKPLALYYPPFWFLGIYQRLLEGPSALPIYSRLAQTGCTALFITFAWPCSPIPSPTCAGCANWS
jgi:hypothetical protein